MDKLDDFTLDEIADQLDSAPRQGTVTDEPEGSRFIVMSDTLARRLAHVIRAVALIRP